MLAVHPRLHKGTQLRCIALHTGMAALQNHTSMPGSAPQPAPGNYGNLLNSSNGVASDSVAQVELVTPQVRRDILSGKDINMATLLIPDYNHASQERHIIIGNDIVPLKPLTDQRTIKPLTIQEFVKAFMAYKNIMCEIFPNRRQELDAYLKAIIDMAHRYPGVAFYEYHKAFSSRCASLLLNYNVKVDWAKVDTSIYCAVFAGQKASTCQLCNSTLHQSNFCPGNVAGISWQGQSKYV